MELKEGDVIGKGYRIIRQAGESSLGDIYIAQQEAEDRQVRLEILTGDMTQDSEKVNRFLQEVELLSTLEHPNLLPAIEAGEDGGTYYLVTASEDGSTLDEYIAQHGILHEVEAANLLVPICEALSYCWENKKLLHRDIKPSNVFVTAGNNAKLTGFGIAKSSEAGQSLELTGVGFTIGTPEYMSPEQIRGQADLDFRCDMYSLGIVLYEAVTGTLPFEDEAPLVVMQKQMDETAEPANERNQNVSAECASVIDRMLMKERDDRYSSWGELIEEMKRLASAGERKQRSEAKGGGCMGKAALLLAGGAGTVIALVRWLS